MIFSLPGTWEVFLHVPQSLTLQQKEKKKVKIEKKKRFYSSCGEEAGLFSSTVSLSGTDSKRWKKKRQESRRDSVLCSGYN